jgi:hypothetical protein
VTLTLPDVSEFQTGTSAPNWAGIKTQNGGAAIIRVGYGNSHVDHMLVSNRSTIKTFKYPFCGLYLYMRADQDVSSQIASFVSWIGPTLNPGEIPVLDLEEGGGDQSGRANQWLTAIDKRYGLDTLPLNLRSWLYSGQNFAVDHGLSPIFHSPRHTWVAAYQGSETGLLPHTLWQSTNGKTGANITNWAGCGKCDTSIYHGTLDQLSALGWHPGHTDPPPPGTFPAPSRLAAGKQRVSVPISWAPVTLAGKPPASYTVVAVGLDGKEYARDTTTTTQYILQNLNNGWTYKVRVWANGGPSAPPHAEITIKL